MPVAAVPVCTSVMCSATDVRANTSRWMPHSDADVTNTYGDALMGGSGRRGPVVESPVDDASPVSPRVVGAPGDGSRPKKRVDGAPGEGVEAPTPSILVALDETRGVDSGPKRRDVELTLKLRWRCVGT